MMDFIFGFYILQIAAVIVLILLGYFIYDRRVHHKHDENVPTGFERTDEINVDPITKVKTRVYYNPSTGERYYKVEK